MANPDSFAPNAGVSHKIDEDDRSRRTVERDQSGMVSTTPPPERAIVVGIELSGQPGLLPLEDSLVELALLADTAGVEVVGSMSQRLAKANPATLMGTGKLEELKMLALETGAEVVIFDDELSPRQQRELEKVVGDDVKVLDRTALILDIFARHARTREGTVQVELAQYEYRLPRLTRAWTHLARQAGGRAGGATGGVGVRGPGETQLEVDRREINRRIAFLKRQLEDIQKHRNQYRRQRRKSAVSVIALVGYTNAGKSTLAQCAHRGRGRRRRPALCHPGSHHAPGRTGQRARLPLHRHRRFHPETAHGVGGVLSRHAGRGDRGRCAGAHRRRLPRQHG